MCKNNKKKKNERNEFLASYFNIQNFAHRPISDFNNTVNEILN